MHEIGTSPGPEGTDENSPARQCWVGVGTQGESRKGRLTRAATARFGRPSRDLNLPRARTQDFVLGYFRRSLRDHSLYPLFLILA
jgi:hypothetical protein